jgi:hypothetical protein
MIEYIIKSQRPKSLPVYSFCRGESKKEVEDKFKKDFPENIIISIEIHKEFK